MTRAAETAGHWLGLCRKPPGVRILQAGMSTSPEPAHKGLPDGGSGGAGTIRRGIGAALAGTKTLVHNPQLLWFSLFLGLVLAGHFIVQWGLFLVNISKGPDLISSPPVTFAVELPTMFCMVFLLAGLALSHSAKNDGPVSFFQGLAMAKNYLNPLIVWSVVLSLSGTLIFITGWSSSISLQSMQLYSFDLFGAFSHLLWVVLNQFPFNWTLIPDVYITYPPVDGIMPLGAFFENALINTAIFSAINVLLFILTLFVVPVFVLERKHLKEAVSGSFTLMKNIRGEVAACVLGLGMVLFAASLTFLLFQLTGISHLSIVDGITSISSPRPSDAWIAAGLLYVLALFSFALIVATVGGIATLELYSSGKTRGNLE